MVGEVGSAVVNVTYAMQPHLGFDRFGAMR